MNSDVETNENELQEHAEKQSKDLAEANIGSSETVTVDPGAVLCAAREAKQLNRAQVGQRLGLTETAVKNLERNKFDSFPNSVYARGYLKNYAKFMELSMDELAELHDQYCIQNGLDTGISHLTSESQSSPNSGMGTKILLTVFLISALAAGAYFFVFT